MHAKPNAATVSPAVWGSQFRVSTAGSEARYKGIESQLPCRWQHTDCEDVVFRRFSSSVAEKGPEQAPGLMAKCLRDDQACHQRDDGRYASQERPTTRKLLTGRRVVQPHRGRWLLGAQPDAKDANVLQETLMRHGTAA